MLINWLKVLHKVAFQFNLKTWLAVGMGCGEGWGAELTIASVCPASPGSMDSQSGDPARPPATAIVDGAQTELAKVALFGRAAVQFVPDVRAKGRDRGLVSV